MRIINIWTNNIEYISDLVIRFLIIDQIEYLLIKYDDYYEIHFNDSIFRIKYDKLKNNEVDLLDKIVKMHNNNKLVEELNVNIYPEENKKKINYPKKSNKHNLQLTKKKNHYIYEKNNRYNRKSHRRF